MGNYISCNLSTPLMKSNKVVRVVLPGGEIRQFGELVKAAELMLECPNFFVANSTSLHIGRRFSALGADEELEYGNVYIMFPMKRVNSVVSAADLATFFMAANSAAKRIHAAGSSGENRVSPESGGEEKEGSDDQIAEAKGSRMSLEGIDIVFPVPDFRYRLVSCRSRKPLLETIKEEPAFTR
ncbi:hypothetical protein Ddye_030122 [Dipteronia dyeriana]|uniref:Uncharacterized protein n=1 Tax=Dipteronia dyeriana TaxID=168575 RepID=A0AAD9TFQ3_9ROSI|nr:hypothetical protein Ddye_030122 [Dipteronia dyeriana]